MKRTKVNLSNWERTEHYNFFSAFTEPFFGITLTIDCTIALKKAKKKETSFFLYYLYRATKAANMVENFRYRIIDDNVYLYDSINASPTIGRDNNTFGFSNIIYHKNETEFIKNAKEEIEKVKKGTTLFPTPKDSDDFNAVIHCSALPWLNFTSMSHARNYNLPDSCPKISFGKVVSINNKQQMSISIHLHHGLADGYHVSLFAEKFQELMNS
ncbi:MULTISPECIES: chloramphenicol acetyltransferase [Cellulophaga]|uniref:Chloramphenicol acetyltransferase n=1 Tax=Cellulophaga geojensis KL-A TaxID=1328323 RepID=A0ABP3BA50_9FLAO|nr:MULTISPECIES: chloramphenicol acetyltransferase [Cellulophaga]AIM61173.1 chloramphenicol acetyltransferase [Cellulophaga lytica]EWH13797.1 chloramphenicol acetyltransferase [Cellulophaga geojensis KL-A]SNQ43345.1 Chloramphenicol acetyltransferase [Cellulophaga lytica]